MVAAFHQDPWERHFRAGLEAARDVAALRARATADETAGVLGSAAGDELDALRRLAAQAAFADLHPDLPTRADEGRWIMERIRRAADALRQQLPPDRPPDEWTTAEKAVLLWADALTLGLRPGELAARHPDLLPGRRSTSADAAAMRVRAVMWLRGNRPAAQAADGIKDVHHAIVTELRRPSAGAPTPDSVTFDYEWSRLATEAPSAERQLLVLLAQLAPDVPVPGELLRRGWEPLPAPLRTKIREPASLETLITTLVRRGLVGAADSQMAGGETSTAAGGATHGLVCSATTQQRVRSALEKVDAGSAASIAVRFVKAALPPDTHHHASWRLWKAAEPHVRAAVSAARATSRRLDDAAHMLDRLAVFLAHQQRHTEAIATSEEAIAIAEARGRPDQAEFAVYLGNLALALRGAGRIADAVEVMDRSLEVTAHSVGTEHDEYATSLNIKGNFLGAMKQRQAATEAHGQALAIIRRVVADRPGPAVIRTLVEILNDTASDLLRYEDPERARAALALLDDGEARVERGDYAWAPLRFNRAEALRLRGRLEEAEEILRDLVDFCEHAFGSPSLQLLSALANLSEVLQERGSPDYDAVFLRAHEIDDALQDEPDPQDSAAPNSAAGG